MTHDRITHDASAIEPTMLAAGAEYDRTIARELTHRRSVSEVFVTSLGEAGAGRFVAGAQLPRMHGYYGDHAGPAAHRHDPLVVMEAARQTAIALTHRYFGVPTDRSFMVRTFNGNGADTAAWLPGPEPADLLLDVRVPREHRHDGRTVGLDMVLEISRAGLPLMTVDGSFSWTDARSWAVLRDRFRAGIGLGDYRGPAPLRQRAGPAAVGRQDARNVVIGPPARSGGGRTLAALVADTAHPSLFDHPLDHVPGSLLLEAARQLAVSRAPAAVPMAVRSTFDRFVELDLPCECVAECPGAADGSAPATVLVTVRQAGGVAARIEVDLCTPA